MWESEERLALLTVGSTLGNLIMFGVTMMAEALYLLLR